MLIGEAGKETPCVMSNLGSYEFTADDDEEEEEEEEELRNLYS